MRRNINILKNPNMRPGIALIMAIGFMVIIAGIMASMMNLTAVTTKKTQHMYFTEQAHLLAKGATEYAILAISAHNRVNGAFTNSNCIQVINSKFPPAPNAYFNIRTTIRYIGLTNVEAGQTCAANTYIPDPGGANSFASESEGNILVDVYVTSIDPVLNLNENISYHRRTLQKP